MGSDLKVAFLDVGHGDFIYAETPKGNNLIIDLGSGDIIPNEFLNKVSYISELQISHPHTDHFNDLIEISKKKILSFRTPDISNFNDKVIGWRKSDKHKIVKLRIMAKTIKIDNEAVAVGDGFNHTVWAPNAVDYDDPNTASLVTTISFKGVKILLGGDLTKAGWKELLKDDKFKNEIKGTAIFKVPHHGREDACSEELFEIIRPMLCIISDKSLDKDNENTAATDWYSKRATGCNIVGINDKRSVLTTRSDGSIVIKVDEQGKWLVYPNTKWI